MGTQIEQDASDVLGVLVEAQREDAAGVDQIDAEVSAAEIHAATNLPPSRINRAVDLLNAEGYAEVEQWIGTAPFEFGSARATSHGFLVYERARADSNSEEAPSNGLDSSPMRLRRPRSEVETFITRAIERGESLLGGADDVRDAASFEQWVHQCERWHALTREALIVSYESADPADEFLRAATGRVFRQVGQTDGEELLYRQEATRRGINTLLSLQERLEFAAAPSPSNTAAAATVSSGGDGVFLVHGHDEAVKQSVARFIDQVTKPGVVILEEQADRGRTLIEKFEEHAARISYAVVLLTGDDEGRKRGSGADLVPRARQNVVLELGFFIGVLRRGRVAMLYSENVELPSDVAGVLYLPLDSGGAWKIKLAREMRAAGVPVDTDALLGG